MTMAEKLLAYCMTSHDNLDKLYQATLLLDSFLLGQEIHVFSVLNLGSRDHISRGNRL